MPAIFEHLFGFNFFYSRNLSTFQQTANMHEIVSKIVSTYVSLTQRTSTTRPKQTEQIAI